MSKVIDYYNYLHSIPEPSMQEYKTSAYIAAKLKEAGYTVETGLHGSTGLVAVLDSGKPGPTLGLRADMDSLPHLINGKLEQRHTCGHDAHCSMLLTAAENIIAEGLVKKGRLKLIFQPGEETAEGAKAVAASGIIDDIDLLLGAHIRPLQECGKGEIVVGMQYSATHMIDVTIKGKPAHGARPHLGINPIDAGLAIVACVNAIHLDPAANCSVKCTRFLADSGARNAIPEYAKLTFDMRAQSNAVMDEIKRKIKPAIENGALAVGAHIDHIDVISDLPGAELDSELTELIQKTVVENFGAAAAKPIFYTPGGEDFFYYQQYKPTLRVGFFGVGVGAAPGLHHPHMQLDTAYLEYGVIMHQSLVRKILG